MLFFFSCEDKLVVLKLYKDISWSEAATDLFLLELIYYLI